MKLLENMHDILSLILSKMYNEVSPGGTYLESSIWRVRKKDYYGFEFNQDNRASTRPPLPLDFMVKCSPGRSKAL